MIVDIFNTNKKYGWDSWGNELEGQEKHEK